MASIHSSNRNPISHISSRKQILRSTSDLHRFSLRRSHPSSLEFRLEEADILNKASFKKLMNFLSKRTLQLKNPPAKEISNSGSLTRHLRGLQIQPGDAAQQITQVTRKFAKMTHFVIHDEHDAFVPMRIRKKVHPMRSLRSFVYDHEFCRDFLRCARYVTDLKIKKTSLELAHLKRLRCLENLHLILRTKYLSLPEEDVKFTQDLGETLQKLPLVKNVTLEQDIDPEIQPYMFMELATVLKGKAKINLIADFLDVSNQRNKNLSVEKIMQRIHDFGIENLKVNYAGVVKVMKRFDRLFNAPVHMREDIYIRFLRTLMDTPFKSIHFLPSIHSYHIDSDLKDTLLNFIKPNPNLKMPGLGFTYHLDMIEFQSLDLLLDLYDLKVPSYEIALVSTGHLIRDIPEKLKEHYSSVFSKIEQTQTEFSLHITAKNLASLESIIQIIAPKVCSPLLKAFNIQLIDPIGKESFESVIDLLQDSRILSYTKQIGIDLAQKENANADELFGFLSSFNQAFPKVYKVMLSYRNPHECERALKKVFERLRHQYYWVCFDYEINNERDCYE